MRIIPFVLSLSFVLPAFAEHRTPEELKAAARAALAEHNIVALPHFAPNQREDKMQILLELEKVAVVGYPEGGFAVIAKDTENETLWGYSSAPFDSDNPAPGFLNLMGSINDSMAKGNGQSSRSFVRRAIDESDLPDHVDPLIKTQWYQKAPYNNLTPTLDGQQCLTGSTATTVAQIVNYYGRPFHLEGTEYCCLWDENRNITDRFEVDLSTLTWDFDQMVSNYSSQDYTEAQAHSVASLMYACGLTLNVMYGLDVSGGAISETKLHKLNYKVKSFGSLHDLAEGNPIIYTSKGNAMIIDGYDENGLMHINFGWEGRDDGYYAMDDSEFKYHYEEGTGNDRIRGLVVTHYDKAVADDLEYYVNPRTLNAVFIQPLKIDKEHLVNTDVFIPSTITFESEEYAVDLEEEYTSFKNTDATSFTFEEGISFVPAFFASQCKNVKEIRLPSTIEHIGDYALHNGYVEDIYCAAMVPPTVGTNALPYISWTPSIYPKSTLYVHVPAEAIEDYRQAPGWDQFTDFVAIEDQDGIEEIEAEKPAFSLADGTMTFTATDKPLTVRIFNAVGASVRTFTVSSHSTQTMPLDALSAGIYIIDANHQTFKVRVP